MRKSLSTAFFLTLIFAGCAKSASEISQSNEDGRSAGYQSARQTSDGVSSNYEKLTACEKEKIIWDMVSATPYLQLPKFTGNEALKIFSFLGPRSGAGKSYMRTSMERQSDFMPEGRPKLVHPLGASVAVKLVADEKSPFSGIFKGSECGILRASSGLAPKLDNFTPGIAIKFFVSGRPSVNLMAMPSLDGQTSHNFFENPMTNFLPPPKSALLRIGAKVFGLVTADPTKVNVQHLAVVQADGTTVQKESVDSPEELKFVPVKESLKFQQAKHEFREDLKSIPAGTVLFKVYGRRKGQTEFVRIGEILTKTAFVASEFQDKNLFFRHQRIESLNIIEGNSVVGNRN